MKVVVQHHCQQQMFVSSATCALDDDHDITGRVILETPMRLVYFPYYYYYYILGASCKVPVFV